MGCAMPNVIKISLGKGIGPWACNTIGVNESHCYHFCYLLCGYVQQLSLEDIVKDLTSAFPVRYDLRMKKNLNTETPKLLNIEHVIRYN